MKDIAGYEGLYAITSCGKVWSYKSKIFLSTRRNNSGYLIVNLCKDGKLKTYTIHRLLLKTYCPCDDMDKLEAWHKDEDISHNWLSNLEWVKNRKELKQPERRKRLSSNTSRKPLKVMCVETDTVYESVMAAHRATGISHGVILRACHNTRNTAGGYTWRLI